MAKILVVDDEENIRISINTVLKLKGHQVSNAEDGRKALDMLKELKPDVIICDIEMPGIKGHDVLKELKENPSTSEIPVIFLTGRAEMSHMEKAMELEVNDFLLKPFTPDQLVAAIDVQLRRVGK
jgi:CheY-like chemotaxis protein